MKVKLSCLLMGYPENLKKTHEMDRDKLAKLTEAFLSQEVEVWPSLVPKPKKRQISETSTPSPKKQKQKPIPAIPKQQVPDITALEPDPDILTFSFTAQGLKPTNHNGSFASFNKMMTQRREAIAKAKEEEEEQEKMLEFFDCCGSTDLTELGNLYDSSDSLLRAEEDMLCYEAMPEFSL